MSLRGRSNFLTWGLAMAMTLVVYAIFFNLKFLDERFISTALWTIRPDVGLVPLCIVDIDDATQQTKELSLPFSRAHHARLLDILARGGARWVVFDLVFDSPQEDRFPGADSAFAQALRRHPNTTLSGQLAESSERRGDVVMQTVDETERDGPLPAFLVANPRWGVVKAKSDEESVVRRYKSWWLDLQGKPRLSLGMRALVDAGLLDSLSLLDQPPWNAPDGFWVRFFGLARSFPYYSYQSVVDDSTWTSPAERDWGEELNTGDSLVKSGVFAGKIVLVGTSSKLSQDMVITQFSKSFPGVELHAHAMGTLLTRYSLRDFPTPYYWPLILLITALLLFRLRRMSNFVSTLVVCSVLTLLWALGVYALVRWGGWATSVSIGVLAMTLVAFVAIAEKYFLEQSRKREITRTFGQYVSPEVVRIMIADPSKVQLGGQRAEISVLFSDFQGFTQLSEILPPERFIPQIGGCFTALSEHILQQQGTLDKYMGDAIMAEFGIPLPLEDKALRACRAAWRMQRELARLRVVWAEQDLPPLYMRVGLATGMALVGNMGSRQLFDYTALGDTVNLGSRLEGVNKLYGTGILMDGTTREQAGDSIRARLLDRVRVVGKSNAVDVWELVHVDGEEDPALFSKESLDLWSQIRACHDRGRFAEALEGLDAFVTSAGMDGPSLLLRKRWAAYQSQGVPAGWDGSVQLDSK